MEKFVCAVGAMLVAFSYVMFFALARRMLTKHEKAEEKPYTVDDEALSIARDEGVAFAIAECIRQGEDDAAEKLAQTWGFHTTEELMNATGEQFDRDELAKMTVRDGTLRVRRP